MPRLWLNTFAKKPSLPVSSGQDDHLCSSPLSSHGESASKQTQPQMESRTADRVQRDGSNSTQCSIKRLTPRSQVLESLASALPQRSPVPYLSKRLPSPPIREDHSDNQTGRSNLTRRTVHSVRFDKYSPGSKAPDPLGMNPLETLPGELGSHKSSNEDGRTESRSGESHTCTNDEAVLPQRPSLSPALSSARKISSRANSASASPLANPTVQSLRGNPGQTLDHVVKSPIDSPQKPDGSGGSILAAFYGSTAPPIASRSRSHTSPSKPIDDLQRTDSGAVLEVSQNVAEKAPEKRSKHRSRTDDDVRAKEKRERHKSSHPRLEADGLSGGPEQSSSSHKSRVKKSSSHSRRRASSCTEGTPIIIDKDGNNLDTIEEKPSGSSSRHTSEKKRRPSKSSEQRPLEATDEGTIRSEKVRGKSSRSRSKSDSTDEKASRELHRSQRASMAPSLHVPRSTPREQLSKLDLLKTRVSTSSYSPLAAFLGTTSSSALNTPVTCPPLQRLPYSFDNVLNEKKKVEEETTQCGSLKFRSPFTSVTQTKSQLNCISPTDTRSDSSLSSGQILNVAAQLEDEKSSQDSTSKAQEVLNVTDSEVNDSGRHCSQSLGQPSDNSSGPKWDQDLESILEQKELDSPAKESPKSIPHAPLQRKSITPITVKTSSSVLSDNSIEQTNLNSFPESSQTVDLQMTPCTSSSEDASRKFSTVSSVSTTQCSPLFCKQTPGSPVTPPSSHCTEMTQKTFCGMAMTNMPTTSNSMESGTEDSSTDNIDSLLTEESEHQGAQINSLTKSTDVDSTDTKGKKDEKLMNEIDQILAEIGEIFPEPQKEGVLNDSLDSEKDGGGNQITYVAPEVKTKADETENTATSPLTLSKRQASRSNLSKLEPIGGVMFDSPTSMKSSTTLFPVVESTSKSYTEAQRREHLKAFEMAEPRRAVPQRKLSSFYMDLGHYTDHIIMSPNGQSDNEVPVGGQDVWEHKLQIPKLTLETRKGLHRSSDLSCVTPSMRARLSNSLKEKNAALVQVEETQDRSSPVEESQKHKSSNTEVTGEAVPAPTSPDHAKKDDQLESKQPSEDDQPVKVGDEVPKDINQSNSDEGGTLADSAKIDSTEEQKQLLEAMTGKRRKPKISRRLTEPGRVRRKDRASEVESPVMPEMPSEAAPEKPTVKVPKPRFEHALLRYPRILQTLISRMDYLDFYTLPQISRKLRYGLNSGEPREVILERFLGAVGYRKEPSEDYMYSNQAYNTKGPSGVRNYRQTLASTSGNSNPLRRFRSTSVISCSSRLKELQISLKDLHAYYTGLEFGPEELADLSDKLRSSGLDLPTFRMIRASTRAYNKLLVRIRSQPILEEDVQMPQSTTYHLGKPLLPIYALGKPAVFKVWVPAADLWMSRQELVECERELWKSEVRPFMRRGDVCHNTAIGSRVNEGRILFDGKSLRELDTTWDHLGHLPAWLNTFLFPPSYYHHVISSSTTTPVFFLDLTEFKDQIQKTMELCKDKVRVPTTQLTRRKSCYQVQRWVYRSVVRVTSGTRTSVVDGLRDWDSPDMGSGLIHRDWVGKLVIEVEGTTEKARDLIQRCTKASVDTFIPADKISSYRFASREQQQTMRAKLRTAQLSPWKIIRERSRPGLLWLQAVYYANNGDLID
ncbi:hypothetical protein DFH28DRAFT_315731 [Melampsora americana]|nr:hypothetical protein DFH28DRAFT_315731 [Melampsora americana]